MKALAIGAPPTTSNWAVRVSRPTSSSPTRTASPTPDRPTNNNLGATADRSERLIAHYLIIKDVSKPDSKTCGDATPIPAAARLDCFLPIGGVAGAIGLSGWRRRRQSASLG